MEKKFILDVSKADLTPEIERELEIAVQRAALGVLADWQGIRFVFLFCSFLPALGILAIFLPNVREQRYKPE